ncbi:MAG: phage portal protein [Lachnospiraceae bacterium]|nr:phage portal protein [Lachnospiraceae bacterium]
MGLFERLFGDRPKIREDSIREDFKLLNGYTPHFTSYSGGVYESELIRSAIHARATHISKLKVEITGSAKPALQNKLKHGPSQFMTWGQFLYRLSTILDIHNTAFVTPVYDEFGEVSGIYCPLPHLCRIVQYNNVPYLRYEFSPGQNAAIELEACGILTKHQYKNDFFGESNRALIPTMDLIHIQNQGIEEGVKSAATYRFIATLTNFVKPDDLAKERQRFTEKNLSKDADGNGGILLFPNTYKDVKQVDSKPFVVSAEQMTIIKDNVYEYFGVNEDILQNRAYGDAWAAFYEGAIEPFAIQFSDVLTKMLFTFREQSQGNMVMATANRLQYMSNADKLNVSSQLLDRGIMSINDVREIWNLTPVEGGDARIIRGEYYNADDRLNE